MYNVLNTSLGCEWVIMGVLISNVSNVISRCVFLMVKIIQSPVGVNGIVLFIKLTRLKIRGPTAFWSPTGIMGPTGFRSPQDLAVPEGLGVIHRLEAHQEPDRD